MAHEYLYVRPKGDSRCFFPLLQQLPHQSSNFLLKLAKSNYIALAMILNSLFTLMELLQFFKTEDLIEKASQVIWLLGIFYFTRYMGTELSTIYLVGFAAYKTIELRTSSLIEQFNNFERRIRKSSHVNMANRWKIVGFGKVVIHPELEVEFVTQITKEYIRIVNSIVQFRRLALLILLASDLLAIPAFSNAIYDFTHPTHNFLEVMLKQVAISTGVLFFSRSYIITAVFSGIHTQSKKFHALLASLAARRQLSPKVKVLILELLESLSSSRNCMAIPSNGEQFVRQYDTLSNFLHTVQFVLLIYDFRRKFK